MITCANCGEEVTRHRLGFDMRMGDRRFCSQECRLAGRLPSLAVLIDQRSSHPNERGCRLWLTNKNPAGYGTLYDASSGKIELAHRLAFQIRHGLSKLPAHVLHHCDTPACVNPDHLFLGTDADNTADKFSKGRGLIGERCPWSILTTEQVKEIRNSYARGGTSQYKLARQFGVSRSLVNNILRGDRWKSVA